jgi:hypothetical protein
MKVLVTRAIHAVVLVAAVALPNDLTADVCVSKPQKVRRVCGVMVDQGGFPISGAAVAILKDETPVATVRTNGDGEFDFALNRPGKYDLDATLEGFQHARYQLTLSKPTSSCKEALRVRMDVGSAHCEGGGIERTAHPLSHRQ